MSNIFKSITDSLLTNLDQLFVAKKTEIDVETGLPFSYECIRCTWIRTLSISLLTGTGFGYNLDSLINLIKGLFI